MEQIDRPGIPVIFVNLYTRRHLARAILPALPSSGDSVYLRELAYEVSNCEWTVRSDESVELVMALRPQIQQDEQRPFSYLEEKE